MDQKKKEILKLSSLWESVDDCLIETDLKGTILGWNPGAEKLYGYKSKAIIGKSISIIIPSKRKDEFLKIIRNIRKEKKTYHIETERIDKNKVIKNVSTTLIPIKNERGKLVGITSITRDITQRIKLLKDLNESEKRYKSLIEQQFDGVALVDKSGNMLIWNSRLIEQLRFSKKEIEKLNINKVIPDEVKKIMTPKNISKNMYKSFHISSNIMRKSGSLFPSEISIRILENKMVMLIFRDISERRNAEEMQEKLINKLVAAQNILKNLSKQMIQVQETERRNIARELHDEIGQTLTAIKIDLINILTSITSLEVREKLKDTVKLVENILNNVREMSLILRPSILDDLGLIPAVRWTLDRQTQRANINAKLTTSEIDKKLPHELEITCFRIIQEAVTNIIKHSQAENMSVEIYVKQKELHLIISDDGIGFDVNSARENAIGGYSIGILGMQERAELVGGWVDIWSKSKEGTRIHAIFPFK